MSCLAELLREMQILIRIGFPMTITQTLYGMIYPITVAFCGALGTDEIDQASLAISIYQLFVVTAENALRWTALTFFGQVKDTPHPERMGIFLQRAIVAAICLWTIALCISINAANYLMIIGQIPSIAIGAEKFIQILMPGCLGILIFRTLMAYLDSLKHVYPSTLVLAIFCGVCFSAEFVVVNYTDAGIIGVAICLSVCQTVLPLMLIAYIYFSGAYKRTWEGWSIRCLIKWEQFYRFLIPVLLTNLVYFFSTELGSFLAGLLGKVELASQSIMFQIFVLGAQLPFGVVSAGMIIITSYVSAKSSRRAKIASLALLMQCAMIAVPFGLIILLFPRGLPRLFSQDDEVIELYASLSPFLAIYASVFLTTWVFSPVLRSHKKNRWLLFLSIFNFFVIGHPLAISLMFGVGIGLKGLWIGFVAAVVCRVVDSTIATCFLNWESESEKVSEEMGLETDIELFSSERRPLLGHENRIAGDETLTRDEPRISYRDIRDKIAIFTLLTALIFLSVIVRILVPPVDTEFVIISNTTHNN